MTETQIVSLFSGYGGLEMGVQSVVGGRVIAHAEFDAAPSRILEHHWPNVPNLGDVTKIDWFHFIAGHSQLGHLLGTYRPGLVIVGGFPCQDVSLAGRRRGLKGGTRSGLWTEFARAIEALRPEMVVIENVRGLLSADGEPWHDDLLEAEQALQQAAGVLRIATVFSERKTTYAARWQSKRVRATRQHKRALARFKRERGFVRRALDTVLRDLADLGYDASWGGVRAADAGAPHGRFRVFIVARPQGVPWRVWNGDDVPPWGGTVRRGSTAGASPSANAARIGWGKGGTKSARSSWGSSDLVGGTHAAAYPDDHGRGQQQSGGFPETRPGASDATGAAPHTDDPTHDGQRARSRPEIRGDFAADTDSHGFGGKRRVVTGGRDADRRSGPETAWGTYEPAVRRWEEVTGSQAPPPTEGSARNGAQRLSPAFVEWMMGLPAGHVTGVNITRNEQLKALGNGVVPQQAALALTQILAMNYALAA